ncbi:hypothetical protein ACROYT_G033940 [Oculina patagonica]
MDVFCNSPCLLVSTQTEIVALDYNNATSYPIISNLSVAVAIDIHFSLGYIFWSDVAEDNIKRAYIDGTNITVLHNVGRCFGLAVEWGSSQLYWTDDVRNTISVSDLEGNNIDTVVSNLDEPWGIALDPNNGLMFWTDWGQNPKIERATLSGTQRVTIVTSNLELPNGIGLDRRNRLVFWVDGGLNRVESVDYHGNNRKLLFHQQSGFYFFQVTFLSSYLFVSDWGTEGIHKFNATSANGAVLSSVKISENIFGLVAYDSSRQLPVITCPALPAPSNGRRLGCPGNATMYYDTVCQFSCNNGYIGTGSQSAKFFSPTVINCTSLMVDPAGSLHMSSCDNHYGAECNFSCTIGYRLNGSSTVTCVAPGNQHPGVWNNTIPTCEVINCTSLTVDPSSPSRMSSCDNHYGAECNFSCTIGYRLNGSSVVTCVAPGNQYPGVWNKSIPTCEVITCPALPEPSNGARLGCSGNAAMNYSTECQFSCNNGYTGSGSAVRTCQHDGTWSGNDFTCQIINCTSLTVNPSGPLRMSSCDNHYGSKCNFSCTIGHRLNGSSTVTCVAPGNQHPGVWNNTIPTCEGKLETFEL